MTPSEFRRLFSATHGDSERFGICCLCPWKPFMIFCALSVVWYDVKAFCRGNLVVGAFPLLLTTGTRTQRTEETCPTRSLDIHHTLLLLRWVVYCYCLFQTIVTNGGSLTKLRLFSIILIAIYYFFLGGIGMIYLFQTTAVNGSAFKRLIVFHFLNRHTLFLPRWVMNDMFIVIVYFKLRTNIF